MLHFRNVSIPFSYNFTKTLLKEYIIIYTEKIEKSVLEEWKKEVENLQVKGSSYIPAHLELGSDT